MLKVGIVGLPNVGKSTLFKVLTENPVDINNYPFCTIDPNVGIVKVKDERLYKLSEISNSKKTVEAIIEFVDIAGLVEGAHKGEGLGNKFLANIREVDLICHMVRFFQNENIKHVKDKIDPIRDLEIINTELILADLETVLKREEKLKKQARGSDKEAIAALEATGKIREKLNNNEPANKADLSKEEDELIKDLHLITQKPILYCFNINDANNHESFKDKSLPIHKEPHIVINTKNEEELLDLSREEAKELGIESNIHNLAKAAYDTLGLITFFTTGEDESRAWTVEKGSGAPEAGAAIHNDFKEKFIRCDVVSYGDFITAGSYKTAREKGLVRTEGKDYIVKDGDVVIFKI